MTIHHHDYPDEYAADISNAMLAAIMAIIIAVVLLAAVLAWIPWNRGSTITNSTQPRQQQQQAPLPEQQRLPQ